MSESYDPDVAPLPEELPPVQPPSAGFILQLFVVPGLIVLAVVAVWLLFGKLATGEQDWQSQLVELQHPNAHRRWRGALGLAQMLKADQNLGPAGQKLAQNSEIAKALSNLLSTELQRGGQTEDDLKYQAFLARTLGLFDLPEIVLPPLEFAMQAPHDREVRKNAIGAVAVIAGRAEEAQRPLADPTLIESLHRVSADEDPLVRQIAAFTLGLVPSSISRERLEVLLGDGDAETRVNAAIGLARQHDTRGFTIFKDLLVTASKQAPPGTATEFERFLALKNCLTALSQLAKEFTPVQRGELTPLLQPLADTFAEPTIRHAARNALLSMQSP